MKGFFSKTNINNIIMLLIAISLLFCLIYLVVRGTVSDSVLITLITMLVAYYFSNTNKQSEDKKK